MDSESGFSPEDLKPPGRSVRIEARPAKDIREEIENPLEEYPEDFYDYGEWGGYEGYKSYRDRERERVIEEKGYEPFDAAQALAYLKEFSPDEQELSADKQREITRQRIMELNENLERQNRGIALLVGQMYEAVTARPETSSAELVAMVKAKAAELRLNDHQMYGFEKATADYQKKHEAVEKYRELYPDDAALFEACFGKKPAGEVRVVKTPMALHFECHDEDDYAYAYNAYKLKENDSPLSKEDKERALLSGGCAPYEVKIPELSGAATLENAKYKIDFKLEKMEKTAELRGGRLELSVGAQQSDVLIRLRGGSACKIEFPERDDVGMPKRIRFTDPDDSGKKPTYDMMRERVWEPVPFGALRQADGSDSSFYAGVGTSLHIPGHKGITRIEVGFYDIKITDDSSDGTEVKYSEIEAVKLTEAAPSQTQVHEVQHLFNRLFVPVEARQSDWTVMARAARSSKKAEWSEIEPMMIHDLVQAERQGMIDKRARDEVMAFYRDGRSTESIFETLDTSPLYNYPEDHKEEIEKLPDKLAKKIGEEMSLVLHQHEKDEEDFSVDFDLDVKPLRVDSEQVKAAIPKVFGVEYKHDIKQWLMAITDLEEKGYSRDEIVSVLSQEAASRWRALARRMGPKLQKN